jgi:hypothetical protein
MSAATFPQRPVDADTIASFVEKGMTNHVEDLKPASDSFIEDGDSSLRNMTEEDEKRVTKALLRKLDTRMLPMLAVLFLFSFLDRWVGSSLLLRRSCLQT